MKPVFQTGFGIEEGNCLNACLASILEIELSALPPLAGANDVGWFEKLCAAARLHGHTVSFLAKNDVPAGYSIAVGLSPRGAFDHAVVALDGKVVHDPHPSAAGLTGPVKYWLVLVQTVTAAA